VLPDDREPASPGRQRLTARRRSRTSFPRLRHRLHAYHDPVHLCLSVRIWAPLIRVLRV